MDERYYCYHCDYVTYFNSRRKTHPCPICNREMFYLTYNKQIEKVTLPTTLKEIPIMCFFGYENLKDINIPDSVEIIGGSSFYNCKSLEEIVLPRKIEKIEHSAFYGCTKAQHILLPASLKKIGGEAFSDYKSSTRFKVIALPKNISEIGEEAFGKISKKEQVLFLVHKDSFAEKFVSSQGLNYRYSNYEDGFLSTKNAFNGVLYNAEGKKSVVRVDQNVKIISQYAFAGHSEIEEVIFPDTLEEIQSYAFKGCTSIKKIVFNNGIKRIAAGAFSDAALPFVDLPGSIEYLSPDAFHSNTVISVDGSMYGYKEKKSEIVYLQSKINQNKEFLNSTKDNITKYEELVSDHEKSFPDECSKIPEYEEYINFLKKRIDDSTTENNSMLRLLEEKLSQLNSEIDQLSRERKHCSIFAGKKKQVLDASIISKSEQQQAVHDEIEQSKTEYNNLIDVLNSNLKNAEDILLTLSEKKKKWENKKQNLHSTLMSFTNQAKTLSEEIDKAERSVTDEDNKLSALYQQWEENYKNTKELAAVNELEAEKAAVLANLKVPKKPENVSFYTEILSTDEILINNVYQNMINNQMDREYTILFNEFIKSHSAEIDKIKEINLKLHKPCENQIENLVETTVPELSSPNLPERFKKLNAYFNTSDIWKKLKKASKDVSNIKNANKNFCDSFFAGSEYIQFGTGEKKLLLFPYCAVIYEPKKPMKVLTYDKLKVSVRYVEKEQSDVKIPKNGELIKEHYLHTNADGSPNKRYKNNPIIKTIGYTEIVFLDNRKMIISIPVKKYAYATVFSSEFESFALDLKKGNKKNVYKLVIASEELNTIEQKIRSVELAEKKQKIKMEKEAAAEKERIREQKIAAEKAAEEKKQEIIRRQKAINEERKRQLAERKEKEKQISRLFNDDFDDAGNTSDGDGNNGSENDTAIPLEVIGNRIISNTVFKIKLNILNDVSFDELVTCFVDKAGNIISNKKKTTLDSSGNPIVLGFVLSAGNDYSAMKQCFMQFESQDRIVGKIGFKMNISFSPDIF